MPFFPLIIYAVLELLIVTINVVHKFPINPAKFKTSRAKDTKCKTEIRKRVGISKVAIPKLSKVFLTALIKTLLSVRSQALSNVEPAQYLDGYPVGNSR